MKFVGIQSLDDLIKLAEKKEEKEEIPEGGTVKFKFKGTPKEFEDTIEGLFETSKEENKKDKED